VYQTLVMVVTCTPKRPVVHPPMRRRARMSRLMQLVEKIRKRKNVVKERRNDGTMNDQLQKPKVNLSSTRHYEAITPSPNAPNAYKLKGLNPSKK
jgi:hypothetical protein